MAELKDTMEKLVSQGGGQTFDQIPMLYGFTSHYKESLYRITDTLFELKKLLDEFSDELHGFSLVFLRSDLEMPQLQNHLDQLCYLIPEDEQSWVDPKCRKNMEDVLELENLGKILKVVGLKKREPLLFQRQKLLGERQDFSRNIVELTEKIKKEGRSLYCQYRFRVKQEMDWALKFWMMHQDNNLSIVDVQGQPGLALQPFFSSLNHEVLHSLEEENPDNDHLRFLKYINVSSFHIISRDQFYQDFKRAYRWYLQQIEAHCRELNHVPILLVQAVDAMEPRALEFLEEILDQLDQNAVWLLLKTCPLQSEKEGNWQGASQFLLNSLSKEDMQARLQKSFPDLDSIALYEEFEKKSIDIHGPKLFYASLVKGLNAAEELDWKNYEPLLELLDLDQKKILYLFLKAFRPMKLNQIELSLESSDMEMALLSDHMDHLLHLGLLEKSSHGGYYSPWKELLAALETSSDLETQIQMLQDQLAKAFKLEKERFDHGNPYDYFKLMEQSAHWNEALKALEALLTWLLDNQLFYETDALLDFPAYQAWPGGPIEEALINVIYAARLRRALLENSLEELEKAIQSGRVRLVSGKGDYADHFSLQISRYYLQRGEAKQALNYAKDCLYAFQKKGEHRAEVYANIELALTHLAQKKIGPALDYFEISRRIAFQMSHNHSLLLASSLETVGIFLFGNLSLALRNCQELIESARYQGRIDRLIFLRFLQGRIHFELGDYQAALEDFQFLVTISQDYGLDHSLVISLNWQARSLIYLGKVHQAYGILKGEDPGREGLFILAEADYLEKRYESALMKLEKGLSMEDSLHFNCTEKEQWCDGFQLVEGWLQPQTSTSSVLTQQIQAFKAYLQGLKGQHTEAFQNLNRLISYEDYPFRPYLHKYLFLLSQVSDSQSSGEDRGDDQLVLLSRSIEKLQSRAGRFDDQKKKLGFLHKNYWNNRIMEEAQRRKFL